MTLNRKIKPNRFGDSDNNSYLCSMKYPLGIQSFEKIITEGYVYVDKTAYIYKMVDEGAYYFLCRPRRFGKSLLVSTMEAYFSGRKELFTGLEINSLEKEWTAYPVFHLDLNGNAYNAITDLENVLSSAMDEWDRQFGVQSCGLTVELRFKDVIEKVYNSTGKRIVILVDEYDKPLLDNITDSELVDKMRYRLKAFYSRLKTNDKYIKFGFLTGVTQFSHVSIFSDLNNLTDISMLPQYSDICGLNEKELKDYCDSDIESLSARNGCSTESMYESIKKKYDGYCFCPAAGGVYNPFSLFSSLTYGMLKNYWFDTATPTYLIKLLKTKHFELSKFSSPIPVTAESLSKVSDNMGLLPIMFQSGYQTIVDYDEKTDTCMLGFPNKEVEDGFFKNLLSYYVTSDDDGEDWTYQFGKEVEDGKVDNFMEILRSLLADIPKENSKYIEMTYRNILYVIFKMLNFDVQIERKTANGIIDMVIKTQRYIYVMELKMHDNGSAEEAIRQINKKHYADPYLKDGRQVIKIGVGFDNELKNITEWIVM